MTRKPTCDRRDVSGYGERGAPMRRRWWRWRSRAASYIGPGFSHQPRSPPTWRGCRSADRPDIQPENEASRTLVQRAGFEKEGYSPRYLKISGRWRDHERWAVRSDA
jgi:hypothetical protein